MTIRTIPVRATEARHRSAASQSIPATQARIPGFTAARAVGSFVPTLTRKVFEKYGFSTATLVLDWGTIVGAELAQATLPERLTWPREAGDAEHIDGAADKSARGQTTRQEATLTLRVDPARALDIQYRSAQILERINSYFGYRAVAQLRVRQAPMPNLAVPASPAAARAPARATSAGGDKLLAVSDERLRNALSRMQQAIAGRTAA